MKSRALRILAVLALATWMLVAVLYKARSGTVGIEVTGCQNGQLAIPPSIGDPGVCILRVMGADLAANMTFEAAALDAAVRCLGSGSSENVAKVQALWGAHKAEELRELDAGGDR